METSCTACDWNIHYIVACTCGNYVEEDYDILYPEPEPDLETYEDMPSLIDPELAFGG